MNAVVEMVVLSLSAMLGIAVAFVVYLMFRGPLSHFSSPSLGLLLVPSLRTRRLSGALLQEGLFIWVVYVAASLLSVVVENPLMNLISTPQRMPILVMLGLIVAGLLRLFALMHSPSFADVLASWIPGSMAGVGTYVGIYSFFFKQEQLKGLLSSRISLSSEVQSTSLFLILGSILILASVEVLWWGWSSHFAPQQVSSELVRSIKESLSDEEMGFNGRYTRRVCTQITELIRKNGLQDLCWIAFDPSEDMTEEIFEAVAAYEAHRHGGIIYEHLTEVNKDEYREYARDVLRFNARVLIPARRQGENRQAERTMFENIGITPGSLRRYVGSLSFLVVNKQVAVVFWAPRLGSTLLSAERRGYGLTICNKVEAPAQVSKYLSSFDMMWSRYVSNMVQNAFVQLERHHPKLPCLHFLEVIISKSSSWNVSQLQQAVLSRGIKLSDVSVVQQCLELLIEQSQIIPETQGRVSRHPHYYSCQEALLPRFLLRQSACVGDCSQI